MYGYTSMYLTIFKKGNNFCDFMVVSLEADPYQLFFEESICSKHDYDRLSIHLQCISGQFDFLMILIVGSIKWHLL